MGCIASSRAINSTSNNTNPPFLYYNALKGADSNKQVTCWFFVVDWSSKWLCFTKWKFVCPRCDGGLQPNQIRIAETCPKCGWVICDAGQPWKVSHCSQHVLDKCKQGEPKAFHNNYIGRRKTWSLVSKQSISSKMGFRICEASFWTRRWPGKIPINNLAWALFDWFSRTLRVWTIVNGIARLGNGPQLNHQLYYQGQQRISGTLFRVEGKSGHVRRS